MAELEDTKRPGAALQRAEFVVHEGIKAESLHKLVDGLVKYWGGLRGCTACGLAGIDDIRINVINPRITQQLGRLDDVAAVSFKDVSIGR